MQNTQYDLVHIGAEHSPLPSFDPVSGVNGALADANNAVALPTYLQPKPKGQNSQDFISKQELIYAQLMRFLPSRGMLPHLLHELVERDPNRVEWQKHSYVCRYVGPPSIGKSFMVKMLGKLVHPKGCLYLNCKDVDMGNIFCETVFDTSAANKEKAAIDAKILQGNSDPDKGLQKSSLEMLRNLLGDAFMEEETNGKNITSIDWNGIEIKGDTVEAQNYYKQIFRETIQQVCEIEGIKLSSDLGQIGITTRDGIAIRAVDPKSADYGRPILLDEFMRCKPGTAQKLYEFVAMLSDPNVEKLEVIGGENRPFTFRRKDLPTTFRVNMTDNPAVRGMGSMSMDSPLTSRLGIELDTRTVPDPAMVDFADRIGQSITGVPIMQIYHSGKNYFDENPDALKQVLRTYRTKGLTDFQLSSIPREEMLNIDNATKIIKLSEQLADFFSGLKPLFDPESAVHGDSNISINHEYEDYLRGIEIDLRLVTKLMEKASVVTPEPNRDGTMNYALAFSEASNQNNNNSINDEQRLSTRGDRLEKFILSWLKQVLIPADAVTRGINNDECLALFESVTKHAANCGIGNINLEEADQGDIIAISDLYDFNSFHDSDGQLSYIRDVIISDIRTGEDSRSPEEILPIAKVKDAFAQAEALGINDLEKDMKSIVVPNNDPKTAIENPFLAVLLNDSIIAHKSDKEIFDKRRIYKAEALINRDQLLIALSQPKLRERSISSLWNNNIASMEALETSDEALKVAAGISNSGYGVTSLATEHGGKIQPVHVVKNIEGDVVVISGLVDSKLQRLMRANRLRYVDYNTVNANESIDLAINAITKDADDKDKLCKTLVDAFLIRNGKVDDEELNRKKTLSEILTSPSEIPLVLPVYATHHSSVASLIRLGVK